MAVKIKNLFDKDSDGESEFINSCPTAVNKLLAEIVDMVVVVFDKDLKIQKFNSAFREMIAPLEEIKNLNIYELLADDVELDLPQKGEVKEQRVLFKDKTETGYPVKCYLIQEDNCYLLAGRQKKTEKEFFHKISELNNELVNKTRELTRKNVELENKKAKIEELLRTDNLTGLANRRAFKEFFEKFFALARRHSSSLSLIMLDLDDFKMVNDTYGHQTGDKVLESIGELLRENTRQGDMIARVGGDEFYILQPNTSLQEAEAFVERLKVKFEELALPEMSASISASFGVVELKENESMEEFLQRVDKRLYNSKEAQEQDEMKKKFISEDE
ncbi:MAG: GGDEF domain-containing protein [Bacillota bacterium]